MSSNRLPQDIEDMQDVSGFIDKYFEYCQDYDEPKNAYEATERLYVRYYGRRKYSNYHCFKTIRNRFLKSRIKK